MIRNGSVAIAADRTAASTIWCFMLVSDAKAMRRRSDISHDSQQIFSGTARHIELLQYRVPVGVRIPNGFRLRGDSACEAAPLAWILDDSQRVCNS